MSWCGYYKVKKNKDCIHEFENTTYKAYNYMRELSEVSEAFDDSFQDEPGYFDQDIIYLIKPSVFKTVKSTNECDVSDLILEVTKYIENNKLDDKLYRIELQYS